MKRLRARSFSTRWAGALCGAPHVVGRLRVVLRAQLDGPGMVVARDPAEQGEAHVDAGRDAGRGDVLAVEDDAFAGRFDPELREPVQGQPVGGGAAAFEETGGREQQGS